jgi:hypothetical protein
MIKAKIEGLDEVQRNLQRLQDRAKALDGTHNVPVTELLTPGFMREHVPGFSSLEEWFKKSGFKIESPEDFKAIPDADWDAYVRSSTSFSNWQEMLTAAGAQYVGKKLLG